MTALLSCGAIALSCMCAKIMGKLKDTPPLFVFLALVMPFAAGGFFTYLSAVTAAVLLANLIFLLLQNKQLRFRLNAGSFAAILLSAAYLLTPLWAADKGMAVFGIVRYGCIILYVLNLMQYGPTQRGMLLSLVPLSGALMTVLSCLLLPFSATAAAVTVNGRLAGFMQYPNTFAVWLLAGLVLQSTRAEHKKQDAVIGAILILGIVLTGSRTAFIMLVAALVLIAIAKRQFRLILSLVLSLGLAMVISVVLSELDILFNADRFSTISTTSGTFLVRLLYFKDALPIILKNPFGIGYMGYKALEGTFQTGRYSVSYIHNGLLQLFLDVGWLPALAMAWAFLKMILSQKTKPESRVLFLVVLGHCMMDFDLQFFPIWVVLLGSMDLDQGKEFILTVKKTPVIVLSTMAAAICLWLGTGDLLHHLGLTDAALAVTPFHTDALTIALTQSTDTEQTDRLADHILALNPTSSLAWSAKANTAFSQGQILEMIEYKEQAIACSRYSVEEYCDYIEKLYYAMQLYLQSGSNSSAQYCLGKILNVQDLLDAVTAQTDPLAYRTGDDPSMELPEEYRQLIDALKDLS